MKLSQQILFVKDFLVFDVNKLLNAKCFLFKICGLHKCFFKDGNWRGKCLYHVFLTLEANAPFLKDFFLFLKIYRKTKLQILYGY